MRLLTALLLLLTLLTLLQPAHQQFFRRRFPGIGLAVGAGIALKSAALGYAAGRFSRRRHCCGGGGGWGRRGGYYGRRRRDAGAPDTDRKWEAMLQTAELDAYFRLVAAEDVAGCGLRLVCELAGAGHQVDDDQRLIAQLFGESGPRSLSNDSPKLAYDAAYKLGASGGGADACRRAFPSCAYEGKQVLRAARTAKR